MSKYIFVWEDGISRRIIYETPSVDDIIVDKYDFKLDHIVGSYLFGILTMDKSLEFANKYGLFPERKGINMEESVLQYITTHFATSETRKAFFKEHLKEFLSWFPIEYSPDNYHVEIINCYRQ